MGSEPGIHPLSKQDPPRLLHIKGPLPPPHACSNARTGLKHFPCHKCSRQSEHPARIPGPMDTSAAEISSTKSLHVLGRWISPARCSCPHRCTADSCNAAGDRQTAPGSSIGGRKEDRKRQEGPELCPATFPLELAWLQLHARHRLPDPSEPSWERDCTPASKLMQGGDASTLHQFISRRGETGLLPQEQAPCGSSTFG